MIKTGHELATACLNVAQNYKTLYVLGCIGAPMNQSNKNRYTNNLSYNMKAERKSKILAASADTFGFDCVCLIKSVLWGWAGDSSKVYGGATYASNGVPDINDEQMINACKDVTTDFSNIQAGEAVWMQGHIGLYIGDGLAVECTPAWDDGVQITAVHNIGKKTGYNGRSWIKHGKLPYVTYEATSEPVQTEKAKSVCTLKLNVLRNGSRGDDVKALQTLLIGNEYYCGTFGMDGIFGDGTDRAVRNFQKKNRLEVDGIVGPATWAALLGV